MNFTRTSLLLTALSFTALAHPMGNFSVNHYSRLHFRHSGLELTYVLDLAEIPTFQLQGAWRAEEWVSQLALTRDGVPVVWHIRSVTSKTTDGAGGMPILRVVIKADAPLEPGKIEYRDVNFPGRAGWKEIVVDHGADAVLHSTTQGAKDISKALTVYPFDASITPPQDLTAAVEWSPAPAVTPVTAASPTPLITAATTPESAQPNSFRGPAAHRARKRGPRRFPLAHAAKAQSRLAHDADLRGGGVRAGRHARHVAGPREDHRRRVSGGLARHFQARRTAGLGGHVYPHFHGVPARPRRAVLPAIRGARKDHSRAGRGFRGFPSWRSECRCCTGGRRRCSMARHGRASPMPRRRPTAIPSKAKSLPAA